MKNNLFLITAALFLSTHAYASTLYESLSHQSSVPFIVETVTDSSKDKKVDTTALKAAVEKALFERKSIHFKQATDSKDAHLKVSIDVKNYYWSDHDPVDMLMGVGGAAMDAAVIEDYAFMQADVRIVDNKDKMIWSESVTSTITKKDMPADKAIVLINDDFAKSFVKSAFSKKRSA